MMCEGTYHFGPDYNRVQKCVFVGDRPVYRRPKVSGFILIWGDRD